MKSSSMMLAGFAAGIAFVVACHHAGSTAHAGPNDCAEWEYFFEDQDVDDLQAQNVSTSVQVTIGTRSVSVRDLPPGWEPFATSSSAVYLRRCKP
jgi:hypothetical protein